ncbi:MAG: hypothetical protein JST55_02745 [Bacteroidetes bacterium]|nr:hypothetical protein [Bacteroidota bacterium]
MRKIFLIVFLLIYNILLAQTNFFCFKSINIKDAFVIEKKLNSELYKDTARVYISQDYIPNAGEIMHDLVFPYVFFRVDTSFVRPPFVEYFFSKKDSTVKLIEYTWDKVQWKMYKHDTNSDKVTEIEKIIYYNKFDSLAVQLINILGNSTGNNGNEQFKGDGFDKYATRELIWQKNKLYVRLWMIWTGRSSSNTNRIRVTVTWL